MSSKFRVVLAWAGPIVSALGIGVSAVGKIADLVDSAKANSDRILDSNAAKRELPRSTRSSKEE